MTPPGGRSKKSTRRTNSRISAGERTWEVKEASPADDEAVSHVERHRGGPLSRLFRRRPPLGRKTYDVDVAPIITPRFFLAGSMANAAERRVSCRCRRHFRRRPAPLPGHWCCRGCCCRALAESCAATNDCCGVETLRHWAPPCCEGTESATSTPHRSMALEAEGMFRGNGAPATSVRASVCHRQQ